MRVLVVTVVHHPGDARIAARQIPALLSAGHEVVYAAPFSAREADAPPGVEPIDLPRAGGRRRTGAVREARRLIRRLRADVDVVMVHDPELLAALAGHRHPPAIWDVHEDTVATLVDKDWMPRVARPPVRLAVRATEAWARRRLHLILAEEGYRERYGLHPVVANDTLVPHTVDPPGEERVVYVGRISTGRGAHELLRLPPLLAPGVTLEVAGWAEADVEPQLRAAHDRRELVWHGRVPNEDALALLDGALAGLSLLHDLPNYRHSRPTKVVEYMAHGVPVVATPTRVGAAIVEEHRAGFVVPFGAVEAVAATVERLRTHPTERIEIGRRAHAAARSHFNWETSGPRFVSLVEAWAAGGGATAAEEKTAPPGEVHDREHEREE